MRVGRHTKQNVYLKHEFTAYMQSKGLAPSTITHYQWHLGLFLAWIKKEEIQVTTVDILKYLEHLQTKRQLENISRNVALAGLNNYFTFLYKAGQIQSNPTALIKIRGTHKRQLYKIYSAEQLQAMYDNYYHSFIRNFNDRCYASIRGGIAANQREQTLLSRQRNYIILGMLVYQGLSTNELQKISITDIDLNKATIKISSGTKSNGRTMPLNASQIGSLINYIENIRPQFFTYCHQSDKLFFTLPESSKQKTAATNLMHVFKPLTKQVKSIDKAFLNFKQVRASVITGWLKTEGLRKAQYMAGHRHISTTEKYLPNQIDGLIDDIAKYNPF